MNVYRVNYQAQVTWKSRERFSLDVEAETEAQAMRLADSRFNDEFDPDNWNAELDEVDADMAGIELLQEGPLPTPRCDKTLDIFRIAA